MRQVIYSKEFDVAVENLGGYEIVDPALDVILDGLSLNPYGFSKVENDTVSFRYAVTERVAECPPLLVYFQILDNRDVELTHVEFFEAY